MLLRLHIYVSEIRPGFVHLGILFIVYVTFIRLIVLYSRCRVNRSTNLSVFLYDVINFCFASTAVWAPCRRSQPVGCVVHSVTLATTHGMTEGEKWRLMKETGPVTTEIPARDSDRDTPTKG